MRIRCTGGGFSSQVYAIRQAIAKSMVAYTQKCECARADSRGRGERAGGFCARARAFLFLRWRRAVYSGGASRARPLLCPTRLLRLDADADADAAAAASS